MDVFCVNICPTSSGDAVAEVDQNSCNDLAPKDSVAESVQVEGCLPFIECEFWLRCMSSQNRFCPDGNRYNSRSGNLDR